MLFASVDCQEPSDVVVVVVSKADVLSSGNVVVDVGSSVLGFASFSLVMLISALALKCCLLI